MSILALAKKAIEMHPAKITSSGFLALIDENPSVFEHWETPLEITDYIECKNSPITHLSKHLTFSGKNIVGSTANFWGCKNLKNATGTFNGAVNFADCGIKKIENLHIKETDGDNHAANFRNCKSLQIATGTYPGHINFSEAESNPYTI
jgi:hypothetical protein